MMKLTTGYSLFSQAANNKHYRYFWDGGRLEKNYGHDFIFYNGKMNKKMKYYKRSKND